QQRLQMGVFPVGCEIIENPFNQIPGFWIREHTFVPGFPEMAWPMIESVLDTRYAALHHRVARAEHSFLVYGLPESRITPVLLELERLWPGVSSFSLPSIAVGGRAHIELGVKGDPQAATEALDFLRNAVAQLGGEFGV